MSTRMVGLASSPSTSCGPVRFESYPNARFRGRNRFRKTRNKGQVSMGRFISDFVGGCEVRPCLGSYSSSFRCCQLVKGYERLEVTAGLEEFFGKGNGTTQDPYLEGMLPASNVDVNVTNLGNNTRKVEARIAIHAPLQAVWRVLTDYDHLADHIPGLAECRVLERRPNGARLLQIGQKNLAFGVKFKAKAVVDVTEEAPQDVHDGILRDLHFVTTEGDFQVFKGTWRMHQVGGHSKSGTTDRMKTYLSYILEVQPKKWVPVALIEGVFCHEITCNLKSVRSVALSDTSYVLGTTNLRRQ